MNHTRILLTLALALFALSAKPGPRALSARRPADDGPAPVTVAQTGHARAVLRVAYSPDGKLVASAGSDQTVLLWDAQTGKEIRSFSLGEQPTFLFFSADSATLNCGSFKGGFVSWDVSTGRETGRSNGRVESYVGAASRDGRVVASIDKSFYRIKLWESSTGKELRTLEDKPPPSTDALVMQKSFFGVGFSPDGKNLVGTSNDDGAILWDVESGKQLRAFKAGALGGAVGFSPDGKTLALGGGDAVPAVTLWETETGKKIRTLNNPAGAPVVIEFSPDGKYVAAVTKLAGDANGINGHEIRLWEASSGHEVRKLEDSSCEDVAFSPDGKTIAAACGDPLSGFVSMWDAASGVKLPALAGHTTPVNTIAFLDGERGGRLLAGLGYATGPTKIWEVAAGREAGSFKFSYSALSLDGSTLAGVQGFDGITVWDLKTGAQKQTLKVGYNITGSVAPAIALSPDGKVLATANGLNAFNSREDDLRLWSVETGKELRSLAKKARGAAFSSDGRMVACVTSEPSATDRRRFDNVVHVWDAASGKQLTETRLTENVEALAFSPDSAALAVSSREPSDDGIIHGTISLFDLRGGQTKYTIKGFQGPVEALAFSRDGKTLVGGDALGNVRAFDPATGEQKLSLEGHAATVTTLAFSPDGRLLASAGRDGQIIFHDLAAGGKEVVRWVMLNDGDYVIVTPDGYYHSTRGGALDGVAFRLGSRAFPFEQFDLKYNRPDIVFERLGYAAPETVAAYRTAYARRLKLLGFTEEMLGAGSRLPEVKVLAPPPAATNARTLALEVSATDADYALDRINVYVNNLPINGANGISLRERKTKTFEQVVKLELSAGVNKIQVSATNEKGIESLKETFRVTYGGPTEKPELYVLAVGVSKYKDSRYDLTYASKDASDLAAALEERASKPRLVMDVRTMKTVEMPRVFYKANVLKLLDADATKENIIKAGEFLRQAKVDDEVLVFFAGHGLLDEQSNYFFGTTDMDFDRPAERGLSYEALESLLDGIASRRKLLLIDTCHAGELGQADSEATTVAQPLGQTTAPTQPGDAAQVKSRAFPRAKLAGDTKLAASNSLELVQELFADLRRGSGAAVIAAAGGAEYALESGDWKNGVFTYSVLIGLKNGLADADHDGEVKVSELRDYVTTTVLRLTQGKQKPTARRENLENDFKMY